MSEYKLTTVHVALLNEGTRVWRPVPAQHIEDAIFQLLGPMPDGEEWLFKPGQFVECREQIFSGNDSVLVALQALPPIS